MVQQPTTIKEEKLFAQEQAQQPEDEGEAVVRLPGGKQASPPMTGNGASMPSFRAMAAANIPPTATTGTTTVMASGAAASAAAGRVPRPPMMGRGPIQFGGAAASGEVPNLPPRTHSAPPAMEEDKAASNGGSGAASTLPARQQQQPEPHHHQYPRHVQHQQHSHHQQHQQQPRPFHPQQQQQMYYPGPMMMPMPPYGMVRPPYDPAVAGVMYRAPPGPHMMMGPPPPPGAGSYVSYRAPHPHAGKVPVAASALPLPPRTTKRISIVNPDTGEDVMAAVVKSAIPSMPGTPTEEKTPAAPLSTASADAPPKITIFDPSEGKVIDLAELVKRPETPKKEEEPSQAVIGVAVAVEEPGAAGEPKEADDDEFLVGDESSIFSGGELSELEDEDGDELSIEDEAEEDFGPKLLKSGQTIEYPRTLVQFSPPGPGEVWRYDRAFLLQFRPICQWKPELELERVQKMRVAAREQQVSGRREYRTGDRRGDRRGGRGGPLQAPSVHVELTNRAANAWERLGLKVLPEEESVLREAKGLLNKLTLDKFDAISDKMIGLGIMSRTIMPGTIDLIFDKAVEEPKFASMYARLCLKIVMKENETKAAEVAPGTKVDLEFRRFLISKCQVEYEKKQAWSTSRLQQLAAAQQQPGEEGVGADGATASTITLDLANLPKTGGVTGELTEEDYALIKLKRRVLGNMRFIGELFNAGLLTEKIMHAVIIDLVRETDQPEEEEVESLCRLFSTVGPKLDTPAAAAHMERYVSRMLKLTTNERLNTRVRFMVLDVLDERRAKWTVKDREMPKTLADMQREFEARQQQKAQGGRGKDRPAVHYSTSNASQSSVASSASGGRRDRRSEPDHGRRTSEDCRRDERRPSERGGFTTVNRASPALRAITPLERPGSAASTVSTAPSTGTLLNRFDALLGDDAAPPAITPPVEWKGVAALSQVKSAFGEFIRFRKPADFAAIWHDFVPQDRQNEALAYLISVVLDAGEAQVQVLAGEVLPMAPLAWDRRQVGTGLATALAQLDELAVDLPRVHEYAATILSAAVNLQLLTPPDLMDSVLAPLIARPDALPHVARVLVHVLARLQDDRARSFPPLVQLLLSQEAVLSSTALKAKLVPDLPKPAQLLVLRVRLAALDPSYEAFLPKARQFVVDELLPMEQIRPHLIVFALGMAALPRLRTAIAGSLGLDDAVAMLITLLSVIPASSDFDPAVPLLNALAQEFQKTDPDWILPVCKALLAAAIIQPSSIRDWVVDEALADKKVALDRLSAWLETLPQS